MQTRSPRHGGAGPRGRAHVCSTSPLATSRSVPAASTTRRRPSGASPAAVPLTSPTVTSPPAQRVAALELGQERREPRRAPGVVARLEPLEELDEQRAAVVRDAGERAERGRLGARVCGQLVGRLVDVDADPADDGVAAAVEQDACDLSALDEDVVRPLQPCLERGSAPRRPRRPRARRRARAARPPRPAAGAAGRTRGAPCRARPPTRARAGRAPRPGGPPLRRRPRGASAGTRSCVVSTRLSWR